MLEKVGLPAKPSAKGSCWVIDASHCQGCSSAFSVFNRKHHCRRCGGIFCGRCTNNKLLLRGQGENPVRICEPCKRLEETARFEARHGHKTRTVKVSSKSSSSADTEALLKQLLGGGLEELNVDKLLGQYEGASSSGRTDGTSKNDQGHQQFSESNVLAPAEPVSPERLRQQAQEEKKTYTQLKRDGKNDEALKAFKRSKELERQADALELALRRNRRKASLFPKPDDLLQGKGEDGGAPSRSASGMEGKTPMGKGRRANSLSAVDPNDDDILGALKDLGWNDADLQEKKQKLANTNSIEADLAAIVESTQDPARALNPKKVAPTSGAPGASGDGAARMQILGHKRRAVALKKEGKLAEAKEELKKAKILERQLEEAAVLGEEWEENQEDDELAALMRNLEKEANLDFQHGVEHPLDVAGINVNVFSSIEDDEQVDVSDADLNDPAIVDALRDMGWKEEAQALERATISDSRLEHVHSVILTEQVLQQQILARKRRALALRKEGKAREAQEELMHSKRVEQDLLELKRHSAAVAYHGTQTASISKNPGAGMAKDGVIPGLDTLLNDDDIDVVTTEDDMQDPELLSALRALGFTEASSLKPVMAAVRPDPQDTRALQQEILAIKRSALMLKREGKMAEAKEELMRSRVLEQKLQVQQRGSNSMNEAESHTQSPSITVEKPKERQPPVPITIDMASSDEEDEEDTEETVEVDDDDFMDPEIAAALQSIGWEEDTSPQKEEEVKENQSLPPEDLTKAAAGVNPPPTYLSHGAKTRSELQKELLGLKRRALALKREGRTEDANEELRQARSLEKKLEALQVAEPLGKIKTPQKVVKQPPLQRSIFADDIDPEVTDDDMLDPQLMAALANIGWKEESPTIPESKSSEKSGNLGGLSESSQHHMSSEPIGYEFVPVGSVMKDYETLRVVTARPTQPISEANATKVKKESTWDEGDPFAGEYGEVGHTVDIAPPLFDHPIQRMGNFFNSVLPAPGASTAQGGHVDLLTGDFWMPPPDSQAATHSPAKKLSESDEGDGVEDAVDPGLMAALAGLGITDIKKNQVQTSSQPSAEKGTMGGKEQQKATGGRQPVTGSAKADSAKSNSEQEKSNKSPLSHAEVGFSPGEDVSVAHADIFGLQQEILAHKRKALALKRDGNRVEATEELRQAKQVEQRLEQLKADESGKNASGEKKRLVDAAGYQAGTSLRSAQASRVSEAHTSVPAKAGSPPLTKDQKQQQIRQVKDRMKLQQESLAHKRKALGLRREGKTEEADAELELARSLEEQMKELEPERVDMNDVGGVENIFDPQLMAALKGLGLTHGNLNESKAEAPSRNALGKSSTAPAAAPALAPAPASVPVKASGGRKEQLEERIKSEKLKAVQLKRAGKQAEALDALREAKKMEKLLASYQ